MKKKNPQGGKWDMKSLRKTQVKYVDSNYNGQATGKHRNMKTDK